MSEGKDEGLVVCRMLGTLVGSNDNGWERVWVGILLGVLTGLAMTILGRDIVLIGSRREGELV